MFPVQYAPGAAARKAHAELEAAVKTYNMALVGDRENFGSAWPLMNAKARDFNEHVRDAVEASKKL